MLKDRNRCFFCRQEFPTNDLTTFARAYDKDIHWSYGLVRDWVCDKLECITKRNHHEARIYNEIDFEEKGGENMTELIVFRKLLEIQKRISEMSLQHDKVVAFGSTRYTYFSFEYLWKKISSLLHEKGIVLTFETDHKAPTSALNLETEGFLAILMIKMKVLDIETGNYEYFRQQASSFDKKDPNFALGSATTYAKRYLLMNTFGIADLEKTAEERAVEKGKEKNNGYIWKK